MADVSCNHWPAVDIVTKELLLKWTNKIYCSNQQQVYQLPLPDAWCSTSFLKIYCGMLHYFCTHLIHLNFQVESNRPHPPAVTWFAPPRPRPSPSCRRLPSSTGALPSTALHGSRALISACCRTGERRTMKEEATVGRVLPRQQHNTMCSHRHQTTSP